MRLEIELVPRSAFWSNVRSQVSKTNWERCKRFVSQRSGAKCEICGGKGKRWPVECHETWEYSAIDATGHGVQTLVGLIALCPTCHQAKHFGRSINVLDEDAFLRLFVHIATLNDLTDAEMTDYIDQSFAVWSVRSDAAWDLDVSYLKTIGIDLPQYIWRAHDRSTTS